MARRNPAEAPSPDVGALTVQADDGEVSVVLVDIPAFEYLARLAPRGGLRPALADPDAYVLGYLTMVDRVAYLEAKPGRTGDPWGCGRTLEVTASAARKGWGPLLYDVALSLVDQLQADAVLPDRRSLTEAAQALWLHYRTKRRDVESEEVPPGCPRLGTPYLDRAYRPGTGFPARAMKDVRGNMRAAMRTVARSHGTSELEVSEFIEQAGQRLFVDSFEKEVSRAPWGGVVANPHPRRQPRGSRQVVLKRRLMR